MSTIWFWRGFIVDTEDGGVNRVNFKNLIVDAHS